MRLSPSARRRLAVTATTVAVLSACAGTDDGDTGAADAAIDDVSADTSADEPAGDGTTRDDGAATDTASEDATDATDPTAAGAAEGVLAVAATAPDGSTFSIADFDGPVLVETFATWCSNCRAQLRDTQAAAAEAGDAAVFLALSVETTLDPSELAAYAEENGLDDILFGVLDDDGLVTLQDEFGGAVLSPPSTPKFRVEGSDVSELTTGFESSDEILTSLGV